MKTIGTKELNELLDKRLEEDYQDLKTDCPKCTKLKQMITDKEYEIVRLYGDLRSIKDSLNRISF